MASIEAERAAGGELSGDSGAVESAGRAAKPGTIRASACLALAIVAGAVAGTASWWAGESFYGTYKPGLLNSAGFPTVEEVREAARARNAGVTTEATLTAATLGASLGLALGLAGGAARRSGRSALVAGASGAVLGGIAGALATQLLLPIYFRFFDPDGDDLLLAIALQAGVAGAIGAAAGAAFGVGLGGRKVVGRTIAGGVAGAVVGVVAFQVIGVLAFPLDLTTRPLSSSWASRLVAQLSVAVLASAGAAWGMGGPKPAVRPAS